MAFTPIVGGPLACFDGGWEVPLHWAGVVEEGSDSHPEDIPSQSAFDLQLAWPNSPLPPVPGLPCMEDKVRVWGVNRSDNPKGSF